MSDELYCADVTVREGDVVTLPTDVQTERIEPAGNGSLRVLAVGFSPTEVVVLSDHFENRDELSLPESATVLSVTTGRSGMEDSRVFYTIPTDEY